MLKIKIILMLAIIAAIGWMVHDYHRAALQQAAVQAAQAAKSKAAQVAQQALDSHCATNLSGQEIVVSISSQHMWACSGPKAIYDNPVVTGKIQYGDSTPLGSYKIFSKLTNQSLKGCDTGGCWDDKVEYWLPYQEASGGTIGFHDATWRPASDFGHIQPSSTKGSHGCVEMPTAAAKWLYSWASVGTSVSVQS